MLKLILGWLVLVASIVLLAKWIWNEEDQKKPANQKASAAELMEKEDLALLDESIPHCRNTLIGLLSSSLPEESSQFVWTPITTVIRMSRYQDLNPFVRVDAPKVGASQWSVVRILGEKAIECIWSCDDGRIYEALFRKDDEAWKVDWEFLVRYSEMPFAIFLTGKGEAEGEFRVLARERLPEERKNLPTISLSLYPPIPGRPAETGPQSPEFLIERDSPEGRLIQAAFDARKKKKRPFDAELVNQDPEGMIRIHAKIRRSGEMDTRMFKITELKACHWYSSDAPGFVIDKNPAENN